MFHILTVELIKKGEKQMNNKIFRIIMLFVTICVTAISTMLALSFGVSNITLKTNNDELGEENDNLTEENDNLNQEVDELNKVVGDLQDTMDNLDEHAAVATYKIDGEVWRIQIVQKNKEFELPVVDETATQVYNGWKVNGAGDAVQTTSISEHTEFELDMLDKDWVKVNWVGLNDFDALNIWTDGTDYYYSKGNMHFKKDQATKSWNQVTWKGLTDFNGQYVWNYNGETYYSKGTASTGANGITRTEHHYVLDLANQTWKETSWTSYGPMEGDDVFIVDGVCYAGEYSAPYYRGDCIKFNGETWEVVDGWLEPFASSVWTDGTNYYYNSVARHNEILDRNTNEWDTLVWADTDGVLMNAEKYFDGSRVWTDGTKMYYSEGSRQNVLDTVNHCFIEKTWIGMPDVLDGRRIWTDGNNIYYSYGTEQYVFAKN